MIAVWRASFRANFSRSHVPVGGTIAAALRWARAVLLWGMSREESLFLELVCLGSL
jgi:hypothetical protein